MNSARWEFVTGVAFGAAFAARAAREVGTGTQVGTEVGVGLGGAVPGVAMVVPDAELLGRWRFTRTVTHGDGTVFAAHGAAVFTSVVFAGVDARAGAFAGADARAEADVNGVLWHEHGELVRESDGFRSSFERSLRLVLRGGGWWVQFADGCDFHPWVAGQFVHECGSDTYGGHLEMPSSRSHDEQAGVKFTITWRVSGPEKGYVMVTKYARPI